MREKNKYVYVGILLIIIAIASAGVYIKSELKGGADDAPDSWHTGFFGEGEEASESSGEERGFDRLGSIVTYNLSPELAELLNPTAFDAALVKFLEENEYIVTYGEPGDLFGLVLVRDTGEITLNLTNDTWSFILIPELKGVSPIGCTVNSEGEYDLYNMLSSIE